MDNIINIPRPGHSQDFQSSQNRINQFALIGVAGYIAPKHMHALKANACELVAAFDPRDSVGIIDQYFPSSAFFTEYERFDRYIYKKKRSSNGIDWLTVCSPNYLHDAHIRFGLRNEMDVICEKPIVLNPWNLDGLQELESTFNRKVFNILQLRLHPSILKLRQTLVTKQDQQKSEIDLTYISARGKWYYASWKADKSKSGGISTNIGIHFFDMLIWLFGNVQQNIVHIHTHDRAAGFLELERARVRWFLSINAECLPSHLIESGKTTYRSIIIDNQALEFSEGFTDLHTANYAEILSNRGFGIDEARPAIELVYNIRNIRPAGLVGDYHPLARLPLASHPFLNE